MTSEHLSPRDVTRNEGFSQTSEISQTAQEFINAQLQLEEDAREALPYQFDTCTNPLGPLRQSVFSCLTCNPPPEDPSQPYDAAGVCYSCSISCHGEHELVELFTRRNFVCDCGTKRIPKNSVCSLRINLETGKKGGVHSQEPSATNQYNQNFRNRFCGCQELYDPHTEKATMFQCLGLGTASDGGCVEDWWHPECLVGFPRDWHKKEEFQAYLRPAGGGVRTIEEDQEQGQERTDDEPLESFEEPPLPTNFPDEDKFEHFLCYKCLEAFSWMKRYANAPGFVFAHKYTPDRRFPVQEQKTSSTDLPKVTPNFETTKLDTSISVADTATGHPEMEATSRSLKRKAEHDEDEQADGNSAPTSKRTKSEEGGSPIENEALDPPGPIKTCVYKLLPPSPVGEFAMFLQEDFRDHLCRCANCFPDLSQHPQLLEEEENYEPPLSTSSAEQADSQANGNGTGSIGSRSLLDRGEAALSSMDRVRAIEGVMVYNHLRDKVKDFLKPFAESGTAVGAEDIKKYFEKLRGDEAAIKAAAEGTSHETKDKDGDDGDTRKGQSSY